MRVYGLQKPDSPAEGLTVYDVNFYSFAWHSILSVNEIDAQVSQNLLLDGDSELPWSGIPEPEEHFGGVVSMHYHYRTVLVRVDLGLTI
jgi:hypothetical protein